MRPMRWLLGGLILAVVVGCGAPIPTPTPTPGIRTDFKLGLVTNAAGTIRDGTFNEISYVGASLAARDFRLDFAYKETIEDKDYPIAIDRMVADGRNIIVTVGFQMGTDTLAAAKKYPNVKFLGVDQSSDNDNVPENFVGLLFREDQGGFLAGALAGMMTKTNVVGAVGGLKIPPVERYLAGFKNGARYVHPDVTVLAEFTSGFDKRDEGCGKAEDMIGKKADVIFGAGGLTGSSAIACAAAKGILVIGVDQDEFRTTFASGKSDDRILSSAVKRVDTGVYNAINDVLTGKFKSGAQVLSAAECGITYAPFHKANESVPAEVQTRLEAIWRALAGGTLSTGAENDKATPPEPLKAGALPPTSDKAPNLKDCTRS